MTIAAIDPSLSCTAVVFGQPGDEPQVRSFRSKPSGKLVRQRISRMDELARDSTEELRAYGCEVVYIEGYSFGSKVKPDAICEYGGLLRKRLLQLDMRVIEVAPTTLKLFAAGKGNASKPVVCAAIARRWDVELADDNEYDAYALWRLALVVEGIVDPDTQLQGKAASAVRSSAGFEAAVKEPF